MVIIILTFKLYLFYNDKETSCFNLYKSHSFSRLVARGCRLCGRKPEYPENPHVVEQVTAWPSHIRHRRSNSDRIGEKWVRYPTALYYYYDYFKWLLLPHSNLMSIVQSMSYQTR